MSFIQSVTGPSFQTGFTFTTNNISVDDISCNTLEANTAVIQDLTTVNFQPIILNTSTLSASAAYIDDIFCQNISSTGIIDAFEINVCNIDIENVSVEKASMTEADVSLLVIKDQTNTKQSEIQRDNDILTIAGGYVDGINQYTGDIDLTPYHQGNSSVVSLKVRASDGGVIIPNLESTNLNSNVINVSYLYVDEVTTYKNAGNTKATILATSNTLQFSSGSTVAQIFSAGVDEYININPTTSKTTILNAVLDGDTIMEGNLSVTDSFTCNDNISTPRLYVNDTFFYGSTGTIVSSLVTMSSQVLYQLGNLDYKIRSVTDGIQYLTCDSTLGNTNISNLSVDNVSVSTYMTAQELSVLNNLNVSNNLYVYGDGGAVGRVRVGAMDFKSSATNVKLADMEIYENQIDWNFKKDMYFNKDDASGQSIMTFKHSRGNVNISNCSIDNLSAKATSVEQIQYRNNPAGLKSYVSVNTGAIKQYHYSSWQFQKDDDAGIVFMKIDYAQGNINMSNLSCANISTNLLNNISAGQNITLSTEAGTNKLVISSVGGLNSSNISLDNLSVDNVSAVELSLTTLRLKDNTQATKGSWFVYPTAMEIYTQNDFRIRNQGIAGSPNFMVFDTSSNNVNISNLSVSHLDVEFVDLTNNLSDGKGINIDSSGGKAVISLQDPMNISTITAENMNVSGSAANFYDGANIYGTATVTNLVSDLTNTLSAGSNITITSVGGKAEISASGGGGAVPSNLSIDNLSVNFDATIGGDLKMLSADIIATASELFIQDVTCTRNMSVANAFGANSVGISSSLAVGTNAAVIGNITSTLGNITATTGNITATTGNINGNNLSVFNDASVVDNLSVGNITTTKRIQYNPSSLFYARNADGEQPGSVTFYAINFNNSVWDKSGGAFGRSGNQFLINKSGWYKCTSNIQFQKVSGTTAQTVRSFFVINNSFQSARGGTFSSSCLLTSNNRRGNTALVNTLFLNAGEIITVGYQTAQGSTDFGINTISSVRTTGGSYILMEYLGGSFSF
jgi:hypothetical protein